MADSAAWAYLAESPGVYRSVWSVEQVAEQIDTIRSTDAPAVFPVVPAGHMGHLRHSFDMAGRSSK